MKPTSYASHMLKTWPNWMKTCRKKCWPLSLEYWSADTLGYGQPESWQNLQDLLLDMELLTEPLDLSEAYTNQFVE